MSSQLCDHHCDPDAEAMHPSDSHFLDCPVWVRLGVTGAQADRDER